MTATDLSAAQERPTPSVSGFGNEFKSRSTRRTSIKTDDIPIQRRRKNSEGSLPTEYSPQPKAVFEDRVESPFKNLSHYADQVDALDDNALDDFVIGEISNRVSSGRTTIGGDSGTRLSKPMLSQTSLETRNLEDSRGLFQPSDGLTLRGFDEISQIIELPENLEQTPFSGLCATH